MARAIGRVGRLVLVMDQHHLVAGLGVGQADAAGIAAGIGDASNRAAGLELLVGKREEAGEGFGRQADDAKGHGSVLPGFGSSP